jgi:hypothetical protein
MRLAHLVHFFGTTDPEHQTAQKLVAESMRRAKGYAQADNVDVELLCVQRPQNPFDCPSGFIEAEPLTRTIHDFGDFDVPALPLIGDLLDRLYAASTAEYLIYSNADIVLMPHFYSAIAELIQQGYHAMEIRRRTVFGKILERNTSTLALLSAELGKEHPGHDCFIYRRDFQDQFLWHPVCVGVPMVGCAVLLNLIAATQASCHLPDLHLTFHLEDSTRWRSPSYRSAESHNRHQVRAMYRDLWTRNGSLPIAADQLFDDQFFRGFGANERFRKRPDTSKLLTYKGSHS